MPRKTKESNELESENITKKATKNASSKKATKKVASTKTVAKKSKATDKKVAPKKETAKKSTKKTPSKTATTKKATSKSSTTKTASTKKSSSVKKATTKKSATTKKATEKKTTTTTKKTNSKKTTTKRATKKKVEVVEYYDLPYRYNQTVVKVLAQTPTNLFIYWDISDTDRKNFEKQYGENFFENTRPILIIHNNTLGYSFEVEINDFANSWYLHVADSKCDYKIELGRRPIYKNEKLNVDYIYITTSNEIESPNDRILFDINQKMVYFRNVKTGQLTGKAINSLSFIRNMGKIYNIYDLYKAIYENENLDEFYDLTNPSSGGNPSSNSFSSKFK